jgi:hypothetical protein
MFQDIVHGVWRGGGSLCVPLLLVSRSALLACSSMDEISFSVFRDSGSFINNHETNTHMGERSCNAHMTCAWRPGGLYCRTRRQGQPGDRCERLDLETFCSSGPSHAEDCSVERESLGMITFNGMLSPQSRRWVVHSHTLTGE